MNGRRARALRKATSFATPQVAILPAGCEDDPESIQRTRDFLHDQLIAMTSNRRASGITLRDWQGRDDAQAVIRDLWSDRLNESPVQQLLAWFDDNPEGVLVVASCDVAAAGRLQVEAPV